MFSTYSVQPLLRAVQLEDNASAPESAASSTIRTFLERPSSAGQQGSSNSPASRTSGMFTRTTKYSIDALDTYENNIYIGTSDGFLLHYVVEEQISSETGIPKSRLVSRRALGFGKKTVERILVAPLLRLAIVLCDSTLSFYSLPGFNPCPLSAMPHIKGVSAFSMDHEQGGGVGEDGSIRLCVAKRRIIQFYRVWPDSLAEPKDLSLPSGAVVVTRWGSFVCVADANEFKMIDVRVGRMISILPVVQSGPGPGQNSNVLKPVCVPIGKNEFLLASATGSGSTTIGVFCSGAGEPVRGTLQWSSYPRTLGVEFPYVAALLRNNTIEIHNILDQNLIQTVRLDPNIEPRSLVQGNGLGVWVSALADLLTTQTGATSLATDIGKDERVRKAIRLATVPARLLLAGRDNISALVTTPLVLHADVLLQEGRVEEAILLSEKAMTTLSSENLHRERLEHELNYIYQKSGFIYLGETLFDDAFGLFQKGNTDPRLLIKLFPDVLQQPNILENVIMYRGVREHLDRIGSFEDIVTATTAKSGADPGADYKNMLVQNVKEFFTQFLVKYKRNQASLPRGPNTALEATDTALLGLWVDSNDNKQIYQLLESKNECIAKLCESKLAEAEKHYALSLWHKSRKNFSATLHIWKQLIAGDLVDSDFEDGLHRMSNLLLTLNDRDLVQEYGWWVLERDEKLGLKIFMPGEAKKAALLDPVQILARCESNLSKKGLISYLEYLIQLCKSENEDHHTKLCLLYIDTLESDIEDASAAKHLASLDEEFASDQRDALIRSEVKKSTNTGSLGQTFQTFLLSRQKSDRLSQQRAKLLQFLLTSVKYIPEIVLPRIEAIPLLRAELGVILGVMKRYKDAIRILINVVKDYQTAESFCLNGGRFSSGKKRLRSAATGAGVVSTPPPKAPRANLAVDNNMNSTVATTITAAAAAKELDSLRRQLFGLLLKEYLVLEHEQEKMVLTLHLLNSQAIYLDLAEVMNLLPAYWSVELLQNFLLRSLRSSFHDVRKAQIMKGVSLGQNLKINQELFEEYERQGPVVITADVVCDVCRNPIADSVFMKNPLDDKLAHLHCGAKVFPNASRGMGLTGDSEGSLEAIARIISP